MKEGDAVVLRNAKIDMYKGSMRLAVDKWGIIEAATEAADFTPKVAPSPVVLQPA
jgi:replication factor A1